MSEVPVLHTSVLFRFDTLLAAAQALLTVLEDARSTDKEYRFTGLTPGTILRAGLLLEGDVVDISSSVGEISGSTRTDQ